MKKRDSSRDSSGELGGKIKRGLITCSLYVQELLTSDTKISEEEVLALLLSSDHEAPPAATSGKVTRLSADSRKFLQAIDKLIELAERWADSPETCPHASTLQRIAEIVELLQSNLSKNVGNVADESVRRLVDQLSSVFATLLLGWIKKQVEPKKVANK